MRRKKQVFTIPPAPTMEHEIAAVERGFFNVVGIDEAGRGPLAGGVVAAAVILPGGYAHPVLTDSKKLTARRREQIYTEITEDKSVAWASGRATVSEIDDINILKASWLAMERAVAGLGVQPDYALIDGLPIPGFSVAHEGLVKGDARSLSISAASIIAKVERDREMVALAQEFPSYGFERHKGYGTRMHLEVLAAHGACREHRRSFAPVAKVIAEREDA